MKNRFFENTIYVKKMISIMAYLPMDLAAIVGKQLGFEDSRGTVGYSHLSDGAVASRLVS